MSSWFSPSRGRAPPEVGGFLEHEKATNKLLRAVRENQALRALLLAVVNDHQRGTNEYSPAAAAAMSTGGTLCLLVPQSVTLDDVV